MDSAHRREPDPPPPPEGVDRQLVAGHRSGHAGYENNTEENTPGQGDEAAQPLHASNQYDDRDRPGKRSRAGPAAPAERMSIGAVAAARSAERRRFGCE